jgi:acyl-coenzyme A thioesterase PaaI-like protein
MAEPELSIQETYYPDITCFGCGHANHKGLKLRSYERDGIVVASFRPWPEHDNGGGFLNGGIIATLLDCHGGAAVLLESQRRGHGTGGLSYVTAKIDVAYLRPTPLAEQLELTAELVEASDDAITVQSQIHFDGKPRATGTALWKRFRPR